MYLLMIVALAMLASCSSGTDDRLEFAKKFGKLVSENKVDSIHALYPASEVCDSFVLNYDANAIVINESESGRIYEVKYNDLASIVMEKLSDGGFKVVESRGIYAIGSELQEFALATGWISKDLNDVQKAENLKDTAFVDYLKKDFSNELKSKFRVRIDYTQPCVECEPVAVGMLTNDLSYDIPGDSYNIQVKIVDEELGGTRFKTVNGKDVAAGQKLQFDLPEQGSALDFSVSLQIGDVSKLFMKLFKPKGSEYAEYKRMNSGDASADGKASADDVQKFKKTFTKMLMVKGGVKVVKEAQSAVEEMIVGATVVNNSDKTISGSDYKVVFRGVDLRSDPTGETSSSITEPGQDIAPGGSVVITTATTEYFDIERASVSINLSDEQLFEKYFKPTGSEYINYKKENNNK